MSTAALACLSFLATAAAEPPIFGWSTHGHDMADLKQVMPGAPEFGVIMLQLKARSNRFGADVSVW